MEFTSPAGRDRYDAFVASLDSAVVGLDLDGTLSPIVDDPEQARIHPDAPAALVRLAGRVRGLAIITGRPARQALTLGGLDDLGDAVGALGLRLIVLGHYGNERWTSTERRVVSPRPPAGLASFTRDLPGVLRRAGVPEAYVEEKGLAVAVHTRRLADPAGSQARLAGPLAELAAAYGLVLEPGRSVIEVRGPGVDKGSSVLRLAEELSAGAFLFAGDDLGDLPAFAALEELRGRGLPTLAVCSASSEEPGLRARADVLVPGPAGVVALLHRLVDDATG